MAKSPATPHSWKTKPMPPQSKLFDLALTLSDEEYLQAQLGHLPEDMDDKWFIYFEDGWLNFHRSWTGNCIYRLRFGPSGSGEYRVIEAWANRSPAEYRFTDDESDRRVAKYLVDVFLLGKHILPP